MIRGDQYMSSADILRDDAMKSSSFLGKCIYIKLYSEPTLMLKKIDVKDWK